jgi:hypothetical protein
MAQERFDVRSELLRSLLSKVEEDQYPSTTMMDLIEELLTPEDVPRYARILLRHVNGDQFPSIDMMDRIRNLAV